jgi:hypothetical protein
MTSFKPLAVSVLIFCCTTSLIANEPAEPDRTETNAHYQQLRQERYQESNRRRLWLEMRPQFPTLEAFHAAISALTVQERHVNQENDDSAALK